MNKRIIRNLIILVAILAIANVFMYLGVGKNLVYAINTGINSFFGFVQTEVDNIQNNLKSKEEMESLNALLLSDVQTLQAQQEQLIAENKELQNQVDELESQISSNEKISTSVDKFNSENVEVTYVDAEIISRNINDWNNKATLNVGSTSGIEVGQPVVYGGALVGFVETVEEESSTIKLLTSENIYLNIPCMAYSENKEYNGIIRTYEAETNSFIFESYTTEVVLKKGDVIYTNGYQENVPKGIPIGTIEEVNTNTDNMVTTYSVTPINDLYDIRYVQVITDGQ